MSKKEYISPSVETIDIRIGGLICISLGNEDIQPGDNIIEWGF